MTHPSPQEASVLLILGEVKGDVKNILKTLTAYDARINAVEDASDARFSNIEQRLKTLEDLKLRIGAIAIGVGLAAGFFGQATFPTILKLLGVM